MVMENFRLNRAQIMLHELYHYGGLVSKPRTLDYAYQALATWKLASERGTNWAYVNADSYALDAMAIYVQQYYKSSMSPVPRKILREYDAEAAKNITMPPPKDAIFKTLDKPPPGWTSPFIKDNEIDMDVWEELTNVKLSPPLDPTPQCTGIDNTNWMGRDALNDAIAKFCTDAETQGTADKDFGSIVRKYNDGGPDQVTISVDYLSEFYHPAKNPCTASLAQIMDSCDGNNPEHNPLNWKHGGHLETDDARYNVFPTAQRYKAGVCSVHIHEKNTFFGIDGPGTSRKHTFHLWDDAEDSVGNDVGDPERNFVEAGQGGKNPYRLQGYYEELLITPQAQNGNYIQFSIGQQSWTTKDGTGLPRCEVGGWDSEFTPIERDMDCYFNC